MIVYTNCLHVGHFIDILMEIQSLSNGRRKRFASLEKQTEEIIQRAIAHYGPVLWSDRCWYTSVQPRLGTVESLPLKPAGACPWSVHGITSVPSTETPPERLAGHIPGSSF